jgi:hypothetical protein
MEFKIDPDRMTLDDLIALDEAGGMKPRQMRDLLARFLVDENGAFVPEEDAQKQLGSLKVSELKDAVKKFGEGVKGLKDGAVPPASGSGS